MAALVPVAGAPVASAQIANGVTRFQLSQAGVEVWNNKLGEMRATQAGVEIWNARDGSMLLTQSGIELWVPNSTQTRYMAVTQAGLEIWVFLPHASAIPPFFWFLT